MILLGKQTIICKIEANRFRNYPSISYNMADEKEPNFEDEPEMEEASEEDIIDLETEEKNNLRK